MSNLMNDWKELLDLMQGLPRASDMYNQVVGDAVVAVERGIKQLEAELKAVILGNARWARELAMKHTYAQQLEATNAELVEVLEELMNHVNYWHWEMLSVDNCGRMPGSAWAIVYNKAQEALSKTLGLF